MFRSISTSLTSKGLKLLLYCNIPSIGIKCIIFTVQLSISSDISSVASLIANPDIFPLFLLSIHRILFSKTYIPLCKFTINIQLIRNAIISLNKAALNFLRIQYIFCNRYDLLLFIFVACLIDCLRITCELVLLLINCVQM